MPDFEDLADGYSVAQMCRGLVIKKMSGLDEMFRIEKDELGPVLDTPSRILVAEPPSEPSSSASSRTSSTRFGP
jgi:hypothetical protein